jgi:hypothetical protein
MEAARAQAEAGVRALRRERMERIFLRQRSTEPERQPRFDTPQPFPKSQRALSEGGSLLRGLALHLTGRVHPA